MYTFLDLPLELVLRILLEMEPIDLLRLTQVGFIPP